MRPITSAWRKCRPALIAALVLLAPVLACNEGDPTVIPTPTPASENIDERIAEAVAAALAEAAADPTPTPEPSPALSLEERIAEAIAAALAVAATGPTPTPVPTLIPTPTLVPTPIPTLTPTPTPVPTPTPTPTPASSPTLTIEEQEAEVARINAEAQALGAAVTLAFDYLGRSPHDKAGAIAYASSVTNADPDAVARAVDEVLSGLPPSFTLRTELEPLPDDLAQGVTKALEYLIQSPHDVAGALVHAGSITGADADALAAAVDQVLTNPFPNPNVFVFPNVDVNTAIAAINAMSQANALAAAYERAAAAEAARQAAAKASAEQAASAASTPTPSPTPIPVQRYDSWNDHEWLAEAKPWWRKSNPYNCDPPANPDSPWAAAGMLDLGGQDALSLIRYFGNGSYVRYGLMGFEGCTIMSKHPTRTHLDMPADPTYYSRGNLEIAVDIARVPADASEWPYDDGSRVDMSVAEAVSALNDNVAAYYRKISQGKLRMTFVAGEEFQASGRATPQDVENQWLALIGVVGCDPDEPNRPGCRWGMPGALNRFLLNDVSSSSGGSAWNGYADFGLVSLQNAVMTTLVHEIGHGWMFWPHSYTELPWRPNPNGPYQRPNFYSNPHDFMSELTFARPNGWYQDMPATLAINRYAAGWIEPENVALHLSDQATYRLARPLERGYQFLVIHSGRPGAFTTLEVLDQRNVVYRDPSAIVYDPASPDQRRPIRYEGVLVSRYDQTTGTGYNARVGPALYNSANPNYESDVGYGRDDYSVIVDEESRSIGGGVTVAVTKNRDGSYDVAVSGGRIADYQPWCIPIWFSQEYDTGCALADFNFGNDN